MEYVQPPKGPRMDGMIDVVISEVPNPTTSITVPILFNETITIVQKIRSKWEDPKSYEFPLQTNSENVWK